MAAQRHITPGLPGETLSYIADMLTLALDATESHRGYSQHLREARSYMRTALRRTSKLMEGPTAAAN